MARPNRPAAKKVLMSFIWNPSSLIQLRNHCKRIYPTVVSLLSKDKPTLSRSFDRTSPTNCFPPCPPPGRSRRRPARCRCILCIDRSQFFGSFSLSKAHHTSGTAYGKCFVTTLWPRLLPSPLAWRATLFPSSRSIRPLAPFFSHPICSPLLNLLMMHYWIVTSAARNTVQGSLSHSCKERALRQSLSHVSLERENKICSSGKNRP